jgi:hypothetical protein
MRYIKVFVSRDVLGYFDINIAISQAKCHRFLHFQMQVGFSIKIYFSPSEYEENMAVVLYVIHMYLVNFQSFLSVDRAVKCENAYDLRT